jgi:hypothetical protein
MHRDRDFVNELRGFGPDHGSADDPARIASDDELYESIDISAQNRLPWSPNG